MRVRGGRVQARPWAAGLVGLDVEDVAAHQVGLVIVVQRSKTD